MCCDDDPLQRGFKKDCRTSDNLFVLYNLAETQKSREKPLYVCYIDLTKAFEYLNRDALIVKLQQRNVDGKFLNTIKSMFHKSSNHGLKIGDLYLAYLLFADDIVLFSELAEKLQAQIELFYKYCEIWKLIISIAKTKIVICNQIYAKHSFSFALGENALEIVDKYKYLGLWCSNNKNIFVKNHSYLAEQARKAIFTIRNYSHSLGHLTPKLSLKVFEAQIEPILMYGSEVLFIGKEISDFEMVHLSFLKNMLGVKQQATSVTIYGDTGRYHLFLK